MGSKRSLACAAVLSWACCAGALAQASGPAAVPPVVRTQAEWEAVLASGQASPLDALTPYGRRTFLRGVRWGDRGLGGFGIGPLVRELDAASVPRFYLLKDGRVIDQVQGWPQGGNRAALAAMLDKAQASRSHF